MIYDRDNLPHPTGWDLHVRIAVRTAVRMDCPFEVWTDDGVVSCEDGWLVLDDKGNPFAISAEEFERVYRPAADVYVVDHHEQRLARVLDIMHRVRHPEPITGQSITDEINADPAEVERLRRARAEARERRGPSRAEVRERQAP